MISPRLAVLSQATSDVICQTVGYFSAVEEAQHLDRSRLARSGRDRCAPCRRSSRSRRGPSRSAQRCPRRGVLGRAATAPAVPFIGRDSSRCPAARRTARGTPSRSRCHRAQPRRVPAPLRPHERAEQRARLAVERRLERESVVDLIRVAVGDVPLDPIEALDVCTRDPTSASGARRRAIRCSPADRWSRRCSTETARTPRAAGGCPPDRRAARTRRRPRKSSSRRHGSHVPWSAARPRAAAAARRLDESATSTA